MRASTLLGLFLAVLPSGAAADDGPDPPPATATPPTGMRLMLSDLTVFRLNPSGLATYARLGLQQPLYASSDPVTQNNFWFAGLYPALNPAGAQLALGGELQPVSVFNLRAFGEVQKYFGTFGYLQSFRTANDNDSDHTVEDLRDSTTRAPQSSTVFHASLQPMLMAKVGPIAVRTLFQLDYWDFDVRAGDTTAYDSSFDTLLPDRGWTLAVDTDVLYTGVENLAVGVRHSLVHPFYSERHFESAADFQAYDGDNANQRIGLVGAYTLRDRGPSTFNKPTVIVIASWYLSHRWRTGVPDELPVGARPEDYTSRAVPYILLGFAFESDLLAVR